MALDDLVRSTESTQYFPQPSIPDSAYDIMHDDGYLEGEEERNGVDDHIVGALRECLEEIDIKGKELFKKIVSNGDMGIPLGTLARDVLGESRGKDFLGKIMKKVGQKMKVWKDGDFVVSERGASIDEVLNQKLERFKVKTVNINGGVGKEEQK